MIIHENKKLPKHIAIIMDGNGRWAKSHSMMRIRGHEQGANTVRSIITETRHLEIPYLTLYTFSSENWNRDQREVDFLMSLLIRFLDSELQLMIDKDIRLVVSGELKRLGSDVLKKLEATVSMTSQNTSMILNLALSYGGRQEILHAVQQIARDYKHDRIDDSTLFHMDQKDFAKYLYTAGMPDPDLMIRTGGECRISNFLLWQMAYTEFHFTRTLWPEFTVEEYRQILEQYTQRERRYGLEDAEKCQKSIERINKEIEASC